jgi:hypothetical protein
VAETRTIQFNIDAVAFTEIAEITGRPKLHAAVGYLASWNMTFGHVTIYGSIRDEVPEIIATYRREAGTDAPVGYCIAAVWHYGPDDDPDGGHFGFHS